MAVKITNGTGNTLYAANGFYDVEAHNLGGWQTLGSLAGSGSLLTTEQTIPFTATTGGTFMGCVITLFTYSNTYKVDLLTEIEVNLQEDVAGTRTTRSTKIMTWGEIIKTTDTRPYSNLGGYFTVNFTGFDTAITIDTTENKRRLRVIQNTVGAGTQRAYIMRNSDNSRFMYAVYADNASTFTTNVDTPIIAHPTRIDASAIFAPVLPTGESIYAVCGLICSNTTDISTDNVCYLTYDNTSAGPTNWTLKGMLVSNAHAGFRAGTDANPIQVAKRLTIISGTPGIGTSTISGFLSYANLGSLTYSYNARSSLFLIGEAIDEQVAFLDGQANSGQPVIVIDRDITGKWAVGHTLVIAKSDVAGQGSVVIYTISSIAPDGKTITLTANLATYNRLDGGLVVNLTTSRYGINLNTATARTLYLHGGVSSNFVVKGFNAYRTYSTNGLNTAFYYLTDDADAKVKYEIKNGVAWTDTTNPGYFSNAMYIGAEGIEVDDFATFRTTAIGTMITYKTTTLKSGLSSLTNIYMANKYNTAFNTSTYSGPLYENNIVIHNIYNSNAMYAYGRGMTIKNIDIFGQLSSVSYIALALSAINSTLENIKIDKCGRGITFTGTNYGVGLNDVSLGQESVNFSDMSISNPSFVREVLFDNLLYNDFDETSFYDTDMGSQIGFINTSGLTNRDSTRIPSGKINRTGDGLPDTTVHSAGVDKFAVRMNSLDAVNDIYWDFNVPTGNVQGLTMAVGAWIKVSTTNYYTAVSNTMPTLTVTYDNGAGVQTAVALQNTDWQYVLVNITPTTTNGQINVKFSGASDAVVESDREFYIDDIAIFYPPGTTLSLGGLDLWSRGLPIVPPIATGVNASDVWSFPAINATFAGSMGEVVNTIKKRVGRLRSLL